VLAFLYLFYVISDNDTGKWVIAKELQVGDVIYSAVHETGIVESVAVVDAPQMMYNLSVHLVANYFVGDGQWLVHNVEVSGVVDNNLLVNLQKNVPTAISFFTSHDNLGVGKQVKSEFLVAFSHSDLDLMLTQYGLHELSLPNYVNIQSEANNLVNLVASHPNRKPNRFTPNLNFGDALVLAEAESLGVRVYTNDIGFFKRGAELQADIQFVDIFGGKKAENALNYRNLLNSEPWRICPR